MIEIAMIATLRPSVVEATLSSLKRNLIYSGTLRLVVDVGPIGEKGVSQDEIVSLMLKYYPVRAVSVPCEPCQPRAQKWVWENSSSSYVLQWEDDWILEHPLFLDRLTDVMKADPDVGMICFDRVEKPVACSAFGKQFVPWKKSGLWERMENKSIGGPPSLMSWQYLKEILPLVSDTETPDIISDRPEVQSVLSKWKVLLLAAPPFVRDIGKSWRLKHGFRRNKRSKVFWEPMK